MKIHVINPNSTASMTAKIEVAARTAAGPGVTILASNPVDSPASIEGYADEALSVPPLMELVKASDADAFVLACFDDSGLDACRAVTPKPVVGICEAAMTVASIIATRFSVVTTVPVAIPIIEDLAHRYGKTRQLRRVRSAQIRVLALEEGQDAAARVRAEVLRAVEEDGIDAVILGCAGMADLADALTSEVGMPVIDGVVAGVRLAAALAGLPRPAA